MSSFEVMGIDILPASITGMSWRAQLAEKIYSETADKKLKAFSIGFITPFGEHGWDIGLINKMIYQAARPLLPGADKIVAMSANVGVSLPVAQSFYKNIDFYAGKDPTASLFSTTGELLQKLAQGAGDLGAGVGKTAISLPTALTILAIGVGGYLIFAGKKGVKLTPL